MHEAEKMSIRISRLYGMDIYTDDAGYIGKVNDVILNLEKGDVVRITTEPLRTISKDEAKKVLREKSILYRNVRSVRDIMLVSRKGGTVSEEEMEVAGKSKPEKPGSSVLRRR